jgi:hypothetical protein
MVKLLATYDFRVVCGEMKKQNNYYFENRRIYDKGSLLYSLLLFR